MNRSSTSQPAVDWMAGADDPRPYYSISEAAALLGVSRATIWRWARAGRLPVLRLGHRTVRIKREDLERLSQEHGAAGNGVRAAAGSDGGEAVKRSAGFDGPEVEWAELSASDHVVQFYESDDFLVDAVGRFIGASLRAGGTGIIVSTEAHRAGVEDRLRADGLDLAAARADGRYLTMNAAETLLRILVDGVPERRRFAEAVGSLIARAAEHGRRVRVFGEMVALPMAQGNPAAALRLEALWNELERMHPFVLMCGYPMNEFGGQARAEIFSEVCAEHSRILPTESYAALGDPQERLRAIAELQQKAHSLEADIQQRRRIEERLRRLQEITGQLSQSLEAEQVLTSIAHSAADLLQVPVGAVFLLDGGASDADFTLAAAYGIDQAQAPELRLPRRASLAGRAIDEGRTLVVDDVARTPGTALPALLTGETTGSEIAAPITAAATTFGVVKAFSPSVRRFSPDDAALLTTLAAAAAVALTNAELYRETRDALRMRDEFLSTAAHDLKNPLASIKGFSQLLRRRLGRTESPAPDWLVEGLASIDGTATQMGRQLEELLDLTRLQLGQPMELHLSPTDCVQLARRVVTEQQQLTDRHKIRVETSLQELIGDWDAVRLGRVLDNLVSNAIKYSPMGGEIVVAITPREIDGRAEALLAVRDHGLGIPAADLPRIFERFRRASNVNGRVAGTGIGLTSARQIVEQHGGRITVESREGVGSTFTVFLPLAPESVAGQPPTGE